MALYNLYIFLLKFRFWFINSVSEFFPHSSIFFRDKLYSKISLAEIKLESISLNSFKRIFAQSKNFSKESISLSFMFSLYI